MEEMEFELGSLLKKAREEKGLSLDDIQEKTKIRKKYLEAIEENNFDILPGQVYLKVFIKGYTREVGLDYQELLNKYEVLNIKEKKESNLQKEYLNGTKVSSGSRNNNKKNPFKIIFIILLILFLGAAAVYTYQYINSSEIRLLNQQSSQNENIEENSQLSKVEKNTEIIDQNNLNELEGLDSQEQNQISEIIISEEFNNQQENKSNIEKEIIQDKIKPNERQDEVGQTETVEGNNTNNQKQEQVSVKARDSDNKEAPADKVEKQEAVVLDNSIEILATDTVWITVDVDGENAFSGILEAGDQQKFDVEDRLYMKIGNGSAITAEMDGEKYGPWAGNGEIAEVEFLNKGKEITINNLRN